MTDITFAVVTDAVRAAGTPADGRIVITSDTKSMYVGDGATQGGNKIGPSAGTYNFSTISVSGQSDVVADVASDTLTFVAGTNVTLTTNATNDSITIASSIDATITALANYNTDGLLTQTAADTFAGRTITGTSNQITLTNGNGVAGNPTISLPADVIIPTVLTVPNSGLHILDTNASHDLIITPGSNLTADRILTVTTGDAARTVTINADTTLSGTNTGDQTITLSGDVTGSGTGSFATNIAAGAVTYAKMQNISATDKVLGRVTAGAGSPEEIACTASGRSIIGAASAGAQRLIIEAAAPTIVSLSGNTTLTTAAHQGRVLYCTAALSLTVDASTDFDALASCEVVAYGGIVTFIATATINRIGSKPLTLPQYGRATLARTNTTDVYLLTGEMA